MKRRKFIQQLICVGGVGAGLPLTGCGTILHSERIHQHHSRDIDWKIAALNGLGLAFFFVPGVIAFAIDFYSGAIYLPPAGHPAYPVSGSGTSGAESIPSIASERNEVTLPSPPISAWQPTVVPRSELGPERINEVVSDRLGTRFSVLESPTRVSQLSGLAKFTQQCHRHLRDADFGSTAKAFFGMPA